MIQSTSRRALIVGLGIAGAATAVRLHRAGWEVKIIEQAPARRREGFVLYLYPTGLEAAERLGFRDALPDRSPSGSSYQLVDRKGRRILGFGTANESGRLLMTRGDVEQAAVDAVPKDVEISFSTVPVSIRQDARWAHVTLHDQDTGQDSDERFDLVVGADGVRSSVRGMLFRPDQYHLERLGTGVTP